MLTNRNLLETWIRAGQAGIDCYGWAPDDVCLVAMPLAHIGGTGWGVIGLLNGAGLFILREFDPPTVLGLIEPERITKLFMVPAALNFLIQMPGARDIDYSRLKLIFYGASPIPLELLRQCMAVFGCGFRQQYGMTEACGTIVYLPPDDHDPDGNRRMKSAGRAMPGIEKPTPSVPYRTPVQLLVFQPKSAKNMGIRTPASINWFVIWKILTCLHHKPAAGFVERQVRATG